ncbi:uncharacterized protein LOC119110125 [Pollicipes pollicipes]|uniref:uncharacterized protein LOC119110125 n=1 Tax=Pollicipes pollicipes TaxID=41117 RepID=UPI00188593B8|nr:uncharacterized protein LOC119110125 [Pollicipes pollicipes]
MLATACFEGRLDALGARGCAGTDYFPSGQGVFSQGQPHGPGQVTYPQGARDAGLWSRGRLIRLLVPSPAAVRFDLLLTGHYVGWYERRVLHVREPETQLETVLKSLEGGRSVADCPPEQLDRLTNPKLRDRRTAGFPSHRYSSAARPLAPVHMLAWNDTTALCEVQEHTYRTEKTGRLDMEVVSVHMQELLRPDRVGQLPSGRLERMRGHAAAVNTLLDHGADVNHVTDEGVSALSVCLALHHPDYATKYHLDQLAVFTYPDLTQEFAGVVEWHGGADVPRDSTLPEGSTPRERSVPPEGSAPPEGSEPPEGSAPPVGSAPSEGSEAPESEPDCSQGRTTPPDWAAGGLEDAPEVMRRATLTQLDTARTEGGGGPPSGALRCCPSLDRVPEAVGRHESRQETAVRLIEAFCSGTEGNWREAEYSTPSPRTVDALPMIKLLLRRGASPEASKVPFPAVHHALLADDKPLLVTLLAAGGDPNSRLSRQLGGLAPLHVSCALPGEDCLKMTSLLLARGADPNVTADPTEALLDVDVLQRRQLALPQPLTPRTPLHVACDRPGPTYEDRVVNRRLMDLLEGAGADVEALCNGHTAMTLALRGGDMTLAVDLMTLLTAPPHHLKGAQRSQKKQREAFLDFLADLLADELMRHEQMAPLVNEGLFEEADVATAELAGREESGADPRAPRGGADGQRRKRTKRKRVLLSAECFCPLCDRVLGKCFKGCPNYGLPSPKLMSAELAELDTADIDYGSDLEADLDEDEDGTRRGARGRQRRRRRAEAAEGSAEMRVEVGALLGPDGKPLKCAACHKNIKRRKILCSACKQVIYCSKQCRASDWDKNHKNTCPARSQMSLARIQSSVTSQVSGATRLTSGASSRKKRQESGRRADGKRKKGKGGKGDGEDRDGRRGRRGHSLDSGEAGDGEGGRRRRGHGPPRGARSLDARHPGHSGLTPMKMPPGLAAFLSQFQGFHIGACRHLILGEWYEDDCKMKQNYSFI